MTFLFPLAVGSSVIVPLACVAGLFIVSFGWYTRRGSAIDQHPQGAGGGGNTAPGADGSSRISSAEDEGDGQISTHGTG